MRQFNLPAKSHGRGQPHQEKISPQITQMTQMKKIDIRSTVLVVRVLLETNVDADSVSEISVFQSA
jgi:hypothetical protein